MNSPPSKQKADPKHLHTLVMHDLCQPVVLHGLIQEWPARKWTPEDLATVLGDQEVKIRIGLKEAKHWASIQWEANCSYETTTLTNVCEWLRPNRPFAKSPDQSQDRLDENPLLRYDPDKYWCYMDYKYMAQVFEDHPNILQAIRWSDFGFYGRDGNQSTIWIGSQGATTPGHYDTYGCNLVAQICGRKKWHLFPPHQSDNLYQTRIPYEESSVFSPINVSKPDFNKYPQFRTATPYSVTLEPGDVLFVPRHWWHFVETVETSISVNTWIEMDTDHVDRFHEAITRTLVSGILPPSGTLGNSNWLNPTEELCDANTNMKYLKKAFEHYQKQIKKQSTQSRPVTSSHKPAADLCIRDATTHHHGPVVQESDLSRNTGIRYDESEEEAADSAIFCSPAKRTKFVSDSRASTDVDGLPDFVTVVPCLGEAYKQQLQYKAGCPDNSQSISNSSNTKEIVSPSISTQYTCYHQSEKESGKKITEMTSKDCMGKSESQHVSTTESSGNMFSARDAGKNETNDVLEILLQSVTHPEVVSRVASLMCKKIAEKNQLAGENSQTH